MSSRCSGEQLDFQPRLSPRNYTTKMATIPPIPSAIPLNPSAVPPVPSDIPTALPAEPDSDDEPARLEWQREELEILEKHLETFRGKNKTERTEFLNLKVVPEVKLIYKGTDWSLRKRVGR